MLFHGGDALHSQLLSHRLGAVAYQSPQLRPGFDLIQPAQGSVQVAKFSQAGFHGHRYGCSSINGIQPQFVTAFVEPVDPLQVANAAVGSQQGDGLIFQGAVKLPTILIGHHIGAADDTAGQAGVGDLPTSLLDQIVQCLSADLLSLVEDPLTEIQRGQAGHAVDNINKHCCAIFGQHFPCCAVPQQGLVEVPAGSFQLLRIGRAWGLCPGWINHQRFDLLSAHHRT